LKISVDTKLDVEQMIKLFSPPPNNRKLLPRSEFLNAETEAQLARSWRDRGDVVARNRLVTAHQILATASARRAGGKGQGYDGDLLQHANMGLLKAADRFDPDMGFRFSTYAKWWIRAEIQDFKIRNWSLVRLPISGSSRKLFYYLKRVEAQLFAAGKTRSELFVEQISTDLAVTPEQVVLIQQRLAAPDWSLNQTVGYDGSSMQLQDLLEDRNSDVENDVGKRLDSHTFWTEMSTHLNKLSKREQEIIIETYVSDTPKTLQVLGQRFGVSRERIRQIREKALDQLRAYFLDARAS